MKTTMRYTMRYHLTLARMAILKRPEVRSVAEDSEERESCAPVAGMQIGATTIVNNTDFLKKLGIELPCDEQVHF